MSNTDNRVHNIGEHIRNCIAQCNPHQDPRLYRVYQEGFVLGHLASIFAEDPIMYSEFLRHCERLAQKNNKRIDKQHR